MGRKIRDFLKPHDGILIAVTVVFGLYLAAATALKGAKWPSDAFWQPFSGAFCGYLLAALWVPLYAFYKALDAHHGAQEKEHAEAATDTAYRERIESQVDRDLQITCQLVAAEIAERCPETRLKDLSTQIWLCQPDGSFDRRFRFFLPVNSKSTGVTWGKGKGVAGAAWELGTSLAADLGELHALARSTPAREFDLLPSSARYGMTHDEVLKSQGYTGIVAIPLYSMDTARDIVGVFVIDYTGAAHFGCVKRAVETGVVGGLLGNAERLLTQRRVVAG